MTDETPNPQPSRWPLFAGIAIAAVGLAAAGGMYVGMEAGRDQPGEQVAAAQDASPPVQTGDAPAAQTAAQTETAPEAPAAQPGTQAPAQPAAVSPAPAQTAAPPPPAPSPKARSTQADSSQMGDQSAPDYFNNYAFIEDPDGYTNVRAGKGTDTRIIDRIEAGEKFFTYPQDGDWWEVQTPGGTIGYVHRSRIRMM